MPAPVAALRMLDIRHIHHQGAPCLVLSDPLQLTGRQLMAPQPLAAVLQFCDGQHDVAAMCQKFYQDYQIVLPRTQVKALVDALDDAAMLDNQRYRTVRSQVLAAYRSAPFRTPALAGAGYSADSATLARQLQDLVGQVDSIAPLSPDWSRSLGVLSPHIDYPRGGEVYAALWKRAALAAQEADLVILLGTDHYGSDPFTLTRQNYATPFGVLPTARDLVDRLTAVIGEEDAFRGELRHRNEHSLELVAVWLHHMRGGRPVQVAPILVGSFHRFLGADHSPADDPLVQQVLDTLRSATTGRRVLVVASGDLAHVGPAFGGAALTPLTRDHLRVADERLIDCMVNGDADDFFDEIRRVRDRNNVCGVAPIYLAMSLLGDVRGEQVGYAVCPADGAGSSAVTISGVVFR
jgi:AmmeMemoRadiSam system protein B